MANNTLASNQNNDFFQINKGIEDGTLNMRALPNSDSSLLGSIEENLIIFPALRKGSWLYLDIYNPKRGSSKGMWLNSGRTGGFARKIPRDEAKVYVSGDLGVDKISVFSMPSNDWKSCQKSTGCKGVSWPKAGDELKILKSKLVEENNESSSGETTYQLYYQVNHNGKNGWVNSAFVEPDKVKIKRVCKPEGSLNNQEKTEPVKVVKDIAKTIVSPSCNGNNKYFEKELSNDMMTKLPRDSRFPSDCIKESLKMLGKKVNLAKSAGFLVCTNGRQKKSAYPPCLSENYLTSVHNSFTKTMSCMGIKPKEIFPLFLIESNFATNSLSPTGARGLGHFIQSTISSLNGIKGPVSKEIGKLMNSSKKECKDIANFIDKNRMSSSNKCSAVSIPPNPLANIFYTATLWKNNKRRLATTLGHKQALDKKEKELKAEAAKLRKLEKKLIREATRQRTKAKLKKKRAELKRARKQLKLKNLELSSYRENRALNHPELKKVINELALYAHNWGVDGVNNVLKAYLRTHKISRIKFKNFKGGKGGFLSFYKSVNFGEKSNRKEEKANYVYKSISKNGNGKSARGSKSTIQSWVKRVNKKVGGNKCGSF
jgi:hypothetical protein